MTTSVTTAAAVAPTAYRRGLRAPGRRYEPVSENPYERFHLYWDPEVERFGASHIGLDVPEERFIARTNPIETVEWLLPGWRVLTRLRSGKDLDWRDTPRAWGAPTPLHVQQGIREHLLMARDTTQSAQPGISRVSGKPITSGTPGNWMLLSLPTTNAHPFFRAWGNVPINRWHFRNWEPSERSWVVQWALRTANVGPTPVALADSLCLQHEDPPQPGDRKWWTAPDHVRTLALALAGQTGSGTHHSGASRKAALALHADTLTATRSMLALGAVRDWDAIVAAATE